MSILTDISENLQRGKAKIVKELVQQAIDEAAAESWKQPDVRRPQATNVV